MKSQKCKQHDEIILMDFNINYIEEEDMKNDRPLSAKHWEIKKAMFISEGYNNYHDKLKGIASQLNITQQDVDWNKINFIYRHPGITLSRDKLSYLKDKYNISVIRDKTKADLEIVSEKTFTKFVTSSYGLSLSSVSSYKTIFDKYKDLFDEDTTEKLWGIFDDPTLQDTIIGIDISTSYYHDDHIENTRVASFGDELAKLKTRHINYIKGEDMESYKYLLSISEANRTVLDTYVNEAASEDSVIINSEVYENISSMLRSVNQEDVVMGMTMMANCNIQKSKTYLGLLFFHYLENCKHIKTWNQVGFKTLRQDFDKYMIGGWNSGHTSRYTQLITMLAEDDALTTEVVESILDLVFKNVLQGSSGFNEDCAFQIDRPNVKLTEKFQKQVISEEKTVSEILLNTQNVELRPVPDLPF